MVKHFGMSMLVVLVGVLFSSINAEIAEKDFVPFYQCSFCLATVDKVLLDQQLSLSKACESLFPSSICNDMSFPVTFTVGHKSASSRDHCRVLNKCPLESTLPQDPLVLSSNAADIRISRALGSKGYDKVRVSVISNQTIASSIFGFQAQFRYRWTDKYLSTDIISVTPGQKTHLSIAGNELDIFLPKEGAAVRGVIIADPCFQSEWIFCIYHSKFSMFDHMTQLLNAIFSHEDTDYWQILGDNFYDQAGAATSIWFNAISSATKSRFFATVPGNHDFWVNFSPQLYVPKDQLGNGFMQFYGQDVIASAKGAPYDFSRDPDGAGKGAENLPTASNYFFYNKVGNVGFIGFPGAHSFASMESYFNEACTWAQVSKPGTLLLLGHWNSDGDGCDSDATVPAIYQKIVAMPSCAPLASKIRYFMGHKLCNIATEANVGFMVGAQDMSDATSCGGAFGIPIVDTTGGRFKVYYFPIAQANQFDNYNNILSCIQSSGVSGCYHLATLWADIAL